MSNIDNSAQCPHCNNHIELNEIFKNKIIDNLKSELYSDWERDKEEEFSRKVNKETEKLRQEILHEIKQESQNEISIFKSKLSANSDELNKLKLEKAQLDLEKTEADTKLKSIQRQYEIEKKQAISIATANAQEEVETQYSVKLTEQELKIKSMETLISELKKKSSQGSMQLQGEAGEILLEKWLRDSFPTDQIDEIGKGQAGADCLMRIASGKGTEIGSILFEGKRTKEFSSKWVEKLNRDVSEKGASIGVIVTETMPREMRRLDIINGVWICGFNEVISLTKVLRNALTEIAKIRSAEGIRKDKAQAMFDFLISKKFADTMSQMLSPIFKMQMQLLKEKNAFKKQWEIREKLIDDTIGGAHMLHGQLQGIAGTGLPEICGLNDMTDIGVLESQS